MTGQDIRGWLAATAFVLAILAIPWVLGYVALAMGAMG